MVILFNVPDQQRRRVDARIAECLRHLEERGGISLQAPGVAYDLRGLEAGMFRSAPPTVRLNPILLAENPGPCMDEVIPHQIAHYAAAVKFKANPNKHGKEWQRLMRLLGATPNVRHGLDTSRSAVTTLYFTYRCFCREQRVSVRRHGQLQAHPQRCFDCGVPLLWDTLPGTCKEPPRPLALPEAPATALTKPPTDKMLALLADLARQRNFDLANVDLRSFTAVRKAIAELLATSKPTRQPSQPQRRMAFGIARRRHIRIPDDCLKDATALSRWINMHTSKLDDE